LGFAFLSSLASFLRSFVSVSIQLRSGEAVHDRLARSVLKAPLAFFEETPSGK
jgi:hypothetical protein